jgi:hypothetical protein
VAQVTEGMKGTEESSRAKVFISEACSRIVDRAVQLVSGAGSPGVGHQAHLRRHPRLPASTTGRQKPSGRHRRKALARVQRRQR